MTKNILIHKNSYSKTHSIITRGCLSLFENVRLSNLHNNIYDTCLSSRPSTIILQLEEYTQEIHQFINDKSIYRKNIFLTIDNVPSSYDKYSTLIIDLHKNQALNATLIVPVLLYTKLLENGIDSNKLIAYDKLYNDIIFRQENKQRNEKILCILDKEMSCINIIKPYLYPNTNYQIVMINNPDINYDQNIGLMFDEDMNNALNTYEAVLDLSLSYEAEIVACGIPSYSLSDNWKDTEPQVIKKEIMPVTTFIKNISERIYG